MQTCYRCGIYTRCTVERCRRCKMAHVAVCRGCERETGGRAAEWQRQHHARICKNVPAVHGMED